MGEAPSILIVEDELVAAEVIGMALEDSGFTVSGLVKNRDEALRSVEAARPTLALVDVRLGRGDDGIELARELRDRFAIPSVILSASGDPETQRRAEEAGACGFVHKPYRARTLMEMLRRVLEEVMS